MATSGTLNSSAYQGRYISLTWSATQDIANNRSTISWTLKGAGTASSSWYMAGGFKVVIDGSTVYSVSTDSRIKLYDGTVIASGTKVINHNSDGTRSFNAYIEAGIYYYAVNCTGSSTFTLDTIPRASVFGTITGNTIGSNMTVNITRYSSNFTNELWYRMGSTGWVLVGTGIATSKTFTLPMSLCNQIPNITSGTLELCIITYYGSTKIGEKTTTVMVNIPTTVIPSVTISVSEAVTEVSSKLGVYVKDLSKLSISANGSGVYGSSISSYNISANGTTYNTASVTTGLLNSSGDMTIVATVTDSRGRVNTASTVINIKDYIKPYVTAFSVVRCNSDGTESDDGSNFKAIYSLGVTDITGNTPTYKLSYKKKDDTTYTDITLATSGSTLTGNRVVTNIDPDKSYDVMITVEDQFNTTSIYTLLGTAYTLIDFNSGGKGIALGKVSEGPGLDVNLETRFRNAVKSEGDVVANMNASSPASLNTINSRVNKLYTTNKLSTFAVCTPVNLPNGVEYYRCIGIGNLSTTEDKYYLLIDYIGKLYIGIQVNKAATITWYEK